MKALKKQQKLELLIKHGKLEERKIITFRMVYFKTLSFFL